MTKLINWLYLYSRKGKEKNEIQYFGKVQLCNYLAKRQCNGRP